MQDDRSNDATTAIERLLSHLDRWHVDMACVQPRTQDTPAYEATLPREKSKIASSSHLIVCVSELTGQLLAEQIVDGTVSEEDLLTLIADARECVTQRPVTGMLAAAVVHDHGEDTAVALRRSLARLGIDAVVTSSHGRGVPSPAERILRQRLRLLRQMEG
jgi:hypothetical protein